MIVLAQTDISSVPAEFVKYFMMMLAFVGGLYYAHRKGKQASGTKDEPLNISQPLEIKKRTEYALKEETSSDLAKLETTLTAMNRESVRQAQHTSEQINDVIKAGADRENKILAAVHDMEKRFTSLVLVEVKALHERMNPVSESVAEQKAALKGHADRISNLERNFNDSVQRLHQRFDDLMKRSLKG